jgi:hypothetical protein
VTRGFTSAVADAWRQHRLEVIAIALLVIAGLIFPAPIWLVGFALWLIGCGMVLSSKLWTPGEKWLSVPVLVMLVIVATAVGESVGGKRPDAASYGDEAMSNATAFFKIGVLLAAVFLAWRVQRGRNSPAVPPWVRHR